MKRKIIFIHFYNGFSGSPKVLHAVIDSLKDYPSILITNRTIGFLSNIDIPKITFRFNLSSSKLMTLFNYLIAQIAVFIKVIKNCNKGDLLYINTTIPILAGIAGKLKGAKIIFHLHEDTTSLNIVHQSLSRLRKYFCDIEVFVSHYLYQKEHLKGKKSYIIHNVLPESFVKESEQNELFPQIKKSFNLLMICSLKRYKGVYEFLKIAEKLLSFKAINLTLLVSEEQEEIDSFFKEISIPKNIKIFAQTQQTVKFYRNASLLLSLSRPDEWIETFGLTILEGMTFGLPCIVPPVGGPIELIEPEINGYRISCYDIDEIVSAILYLYQDKKIYAEMSENNILKSKSFSYDIYRLKLNNLIKEISGKNES